MSLTTLLFSFQGRINRGKYWLATLIYVLASIIFALVIFAVIGPASLDDSTNPAGVLVASGLGLALFALCAWSSLATGIKRLHDRDESGWWMLVFLAVSTTVSLLQEAATTPGNKILFGVGSFAVSVWIVIELGCLRGTHGPNRFGPDPLQATPR